MIKRISTAIVLIAFILLILQWAPLWIFRGIIFLIIAGALHEYYRLVAHNDKFVFITGLIFGLIFAGILVFDWPDKFYLYPIIIASFFALILAHMAYYTTVERSISRLGLILFGTAYLALTLPAFVWLRDSFYGRTLIIMTIGIVALGDTFAMFSGKLIGRHKLSPLISPNKTVEGLIASFFGGILAVAICWYFFWNELPFYMIFFLGISVALVGALGDLIESMIKRDYHVKDSGTLLPGHGGILDRIDGLVFAAPFVYYTFKFLGII